MMTGPWQCPDCKTWIRADVTEHRCGPGTGSVPAVPAIPPGGGAGSGTAGPWQGPPGTTVTVTGTAAQPADFGRQVVTSIREYEKRAGPGWRHRTA
jgi:hypothetical protein